jgi:hypothetical protein
MAPHPPRFRRLALALTLSLFIHVLLAGAISLIRERTTTDDGTPAEDRPGLSISLVGWNKRPRPVVSPHPRPAKTDAGPFVHVVGPGEVMDPPTRSSPLPGSVAGRGPDPASAATGPEEKDHHSMGRGLLPVPATARRVVYLVDRSVSMGPFGALATARQEVAACLRSLPPDTLFQVIAYNKVAEPLELSGRRDLVEADPDTVELAIKLLDAIRPSGATDSAQALFRALQMRPDIVFLLTDADDLTRARVDALLRLKGRAVLHVVELSRGRPNQADGPLAQLARATGSGDNRGSYRRVVPDR